MPRYFEVCKNYINQDGETSIKLPERSTKNSAGYDFYASENVVIPSIWKGLFRRLLGKGKVIKPTIVHTHVKAKMNANEYLLLANRSSNPSKYGLIMANSVGIVDSDYYSNPDNDGDIGFPFYNIFPWDIYIIKDQKLGQGIFHTFLKVDSERTPKKTRSGGFGSTDDWF